MKSRKYTCQYGGSSTPVVIEKGEVARDNQGNLVKVSPYAPSHSESHLVTPFGIQKVPSGKGGVLTHNLESVLSDSQSQINAGDRDNNVKDEVIKITPAEARKIGESMGLKVNVSSSISPTKLFETLRTFRDAAAKKFTLSDKNKNQQGKAFESAQQVNAIQQRQLPSDDQLYDHVFSIQEGAKSMSNIDFDDTEHAKHGIYIKPSHRGRFTAYKERTGKTTEEALHSKDPHVRKMAQFAQNAKHWNHKQHGGLSIDGYKNDSDDRFNDYNIIPSNSITMENVDQPLMLYGDGGEVVYAEPGQDYVLPNSQSVLEIPIAQQGYNPVQEQQRYNQFFPKTLRDKVNAVKELYQKKYPKDKKGLATIDKYNEGHVLTEPDDFDGSTFARNFPRFDSDYQQYQQKLLSIPNDQVVEMVRSSKNPVSFMFSKFPDQFTKWDAIQLGRKVKADQEKYTFQQGGSPRKWYPADIADNKEWLSHHGTSSSHIGTKAAKELWPGNPTMVGAPGTYKTPVPDTLPEHTLAPVTVTAKRLSNTGSTGTGKKFVPSSKRTVEVVKPGIVGHNALDPYSLLPSPENEGPYPVLAVDKPTTSIPVSRLEAAINDLPTQIPDRGVDESDLTYTPIRQESPVPAENPFKIDKGQLLPETLMALDALNRQPGYLQHLYEPDLQLEKLNSTGTRQALVNTYRAANNNIQDPHTQIGRAQGVQQYTNLLNALSNLNSQYDNQNTAIENQQRQYNSQLHQNTDQFNMGQNDQYYQRDLASKEAQRQQLFTALNSAVAKTAQAKQEERNYNLFKSTYAPKYRVKRDGTLEFDSSSAPVQFDTDGIIATPVSNQGKRKTTTTLDKNGQIKETKIEQDELNMLNQLRRQKGLPLISL